MLAISGGKLERATSCVSHEWFLDHFLIFCQKRVNILKFVSMSAVTPYRNYVQYEERYAVPITQVPFQYKQ